MSLKVTENGTIRTVIKLLKGIAGGSLNSGVNVELVHQCDGHLSR